jgi:hypothetical protein
VQIPSGEWEKKARLEQLHNNLMKLSELCDIDEHYGLKFSQMLQMATSKLVGCEARLEVCKLKHAYRGSQWFGLTRDGIKESFGWDMKEKKLRRMSGNFWKQYVGENTFIPGLEGLLGNPEIQNAQGLQVAIAFTKDLKKLLGKKNTYGGYRSRDVAFEKDYELPSPVKYQEDLNLESPSKHTIKKIHIHISGGYGGVTIKLGGGAAGDELDFNVNQEQSRLDINKYIGVSEPEIYDNLVAVMERAAGEAKTYLDQVGKNWKEIMEKYGQFAMLVEMGDTDV